MCRALLLALALIVTNPPQLLSQESSDVDAIAEKAYAEFEKGDYEQAIETINQVIALDPDDGYSFILRGAANLKLGKDAEIALRDLNEGLTKSPDNAWGYCSRGWLFNKLGKTDKALADLSKAIAIDPTNTYALYERGTTFLGQPGKMDLAIADFTKSIELKSQFAEAFGNRADALLNKNECKDALADINKATELDPGRGAYYKLRAQIYQKGETADLPKALQDIDKAIVLEPRCGAHWAVRGTVHCKKGDFERGIADFKKAIELDPQDDLSYLLRAAVYADKGDFGNAVADCAAAIRFRPWAGAHSLRAIILVKQGQYDKAML